MRQIESCRTLTPAPQMAFACRRLVPGGPFAVGDRIPAPSPTADSFTPKSARRPSDIPQEERSRS